MDKTQQSIDDIVDGMKDTDFYRSLPSKPTPWYNKHGDSVIFISAPEDTVAEWVDNHLTLYRSALDDRLIGFKLKDINALRREFDGDFSQIAGAYSEDKGQGITIFFLLFAAMQLTTKKADPKAVIAYAQVAAEYKDIEPLDPNELVEAEAAC